MDLFANVDWGELEDVVSSNFPRDPALFDAAEIPSWDGDDYSAITRTSLEPNQSANSATGMVNLDHSMTFNLDSTNAWGAPKPPPDDDMMDIDDIVPLRQPQPARPQPLRISAPTARPARGPPTSEMWDEHKARIKRLYLDEDTPLPQLMELMKKDFDFHATDNMYKKRFKLWGFAKNNKEADVRAMVALRKRRQDEGKATRFFIDSRPVNFERVNKYLRRKKLSPAVFLTAAIASRSESQVAHYLSCRTPSPPPFLRSPDTYRHSEALIAATHDYVIILLGPDHLETETNNLFRYRGFTWTLSDESNLCVLLLESGDFQTAGRVLRRLARRLETEIQLQSFDIFAQLLLMPAAMGQTWMETTTCIIRHAAALARRYIESANHPLRRALERLDACDPTDVLSLSASAFVCYLDAISNVFGKDSFAAIDHGRMQLSTMETVIEERYASAIRKFDHELLRCEAQSGEFDQATRTLCCLGSAAEWEIDHAMKTGSITSLDSALRCYELALELAVKEEYIDWKFKAEFSIAWMHDIKGAHELAHQYKWAAVETLFCHLESSLEALGHQAAEFEGWLRRCGDHELARSVREKLGAFFPLDEIEVAAMAGLAIV